MGWEGMPLQNVNRLSQLLDLRRDMPWSVLDKRWRPVDESFLASMPRVAGCPGNRKHDFALISIVTSSVETQRLRRQGQDLLAGWSAHAW